MTQSLPVRIAVLLPTSDYRAYVRATQILARIMGAAAPDVLALIRFNLHDRDANGVADDYLDAIRWPNSAGRVVSLRRRRETPRSARTKTQKERLTDSTRTMSVRSDSPGDPGRN